eukprot:scaffold71645_cov66-Phaeocystis_antarctica.AAC.4
MATLTYYGYTYLLHDERHAARVAAEARVVQVDAASLHGEEGAHEGLGLAHLCREHALRLRLDRSLEEGEAFERLEAHLAQELGEVGAHL